MKLQSACSMHGASNIIEYGSREAVKAGRLAALRKAVDALQAIPAGSLPKNISAAPGPFLAPGLPAPGLLGGVLNEVVASHADRPAAFAFLFTLMASVLRVRTGSAIFVAARRALDFGAPYGHGLARLGLDISRLLLVETETDKDALWALEETLRSAVKPSVVTGVVEAGLDLTQSRRLNLAAAVHATPLALIRGEKAMGTSAAATRWRLASAPARLDRFDLFERWRWHATLERSRGGRVGSWLIEWDPDGQRFLPIEGTPNRGIAAGADRHQAGLA